MKKSLLSIFVIILLVLSSVPVYAQTDIECSVFERHAVGNRQFIEMPILGLNRVTFNSVDRADTLYYDFSRNKNKISFIGVTPGEVHLTIREVSTILETKTNPKTGKDEYTGKILGYNLKPEAECHNEPFDEFFNITNGKNVIVIELKQRITASQYELNPALAIADSPMVSFRGDTLVYNTDMVILESNSYAIDVLKQLPGAEIQGRSILILGQNVARTYVNGALIFGYDPMDAMDYLKADQITSIESYMEENPQDKIDGRRRERQRVLNIKTKEPIISVIDFQMRIYGGLDHTKMDDGSHQKRYLAGAEGRFFSEKLLIKTGVSLNNLGVSSFQYMSQLPSSLGGYSENISANLGFEKYWKGLLNPDGIKFNYDYSHNWSKSYSSALTERFEMNGIPAQDDILSSYNSILSRRHALHSTISVGNGDIVHFRWENEITMNDANNTSEQSGYTLISGQDKMMKNQVQGESQDSWSISERVSFGIKPRNRIHTIGLNLQLGHEDLSSWDIDTTSSSYLKRYITKDKGDIPLSFGGNYNVFLFNVGKYSRTINFSLNESVSYSRRKSIQSAFDMYGTDSPSVNAANTYDYTQSTLSNRTGIAFMGFITEDTSVNGSLAVATDRIVDVGRIPQSDVNRPFVGIEPDIMFSKHFNRNDRQQIFNISYNLKSSLPSVEQLRGRINDNNPLSLIAGNPDIKKSTIHSMVSNYQLNTFGKRKSANFQVQLRAGMTVNPITRKLIYFSESDVLEKYGNYHVPAGATLNVSENTAPSYSASMQLTYSNTYVMFNGKIRPRLRLSPTVSYNDRPQYFGDKLDRTEELSPSLSMNIRADANSFEMSISGSTRYTHVWNSETSIVKNLTSSISTDITKHILKYIVIGVNYSASNFTYLKGSYNDKTIHRLGSSVGLELFNGNFQINLSGYDLLNGGSSYTIVTGPSSVIQTWNPVYGRYFLLGAIWRFNSSGGKSFLSRSI